MQLVIYAFPFEVSLFIRGHLRPTPRAACLQQLWLQARRRAHAGMLSLPHLQAGNWLPLHFITVWRRCTLVWRRKDHIFGSRGRGCARASGRKSPQRPQTGPRIFSMAGGHETRGLFLRVTRFLPRAQSGSWQDVSARGGAERPGAPRCRRREWTPKLETLLDRRMNPPAWPAEPARARGLVREQLERPERKGVRGPRTWTLEPQRPWKAARRPRRARVRSAAVETRRDRRVSGRTGL